MKKLTLADVKAIRTPLAELALVGCELNAEIGIDAAACIQLAKNGHSSP